MKVKLAKGLKTSDNSEKRKKTTFYLKNLPMRNEKNYCRDFPPQISTNNYDKNYANFLCFIVFPSPKL